MNIYSALRSRNPQQRKQLIARIRRYINDDGFAHILESIDVQNLDSIRHACLQLNAYQRVPYLRPRVMTWLQGF